MEKYGSFSFHVFFWNKTTLNRYFFLDKVNVFLSEMDIGDSYSRDGNWVETLF